MLLRTNVSHAMPLDRCADGLCHRQRKTGSQTNCCALHKAGLNAQGCVFNLLLLAEQGSTCCRGCMVLWHLALTWLVLGTR